VGVTKATVDLDSSLVEQNERAGVLFIASGGSVLRTLIRKNTFSVNLEEGASPLIGADNEMVENKVNRITLGQSLNAAPIPPAPKL